MSPPVISNKQIILGLILIAIPLYFVLAGLYANYRESTQIPMRMFFERPKPSLPVCNYSGAPESYRTAASLFNKSFTLGDIDNAVLNWTNHRNCTLPSFNDVQPKVIFILPYRSRSKDLIGFLLHMFSYMRLQKVKSEFFVVEQNGTRPFNRAKLFNAAIREIDIASRNSISDRLSGSSCFALHDVDKLPNVPDVPYTCESGPHQLLRYCKYKEGGMQ